MTVHLRPAKQSDIPSLVSIWAQSFQNDTHTQLKGLAQDPPVTAVEYISQGADAFFKSQLNRPAASVTVATIQGSSTIVGFLISGSKHILPAEQQPLHDTIVSTRGPAPSPPILLTSSGTVADLARITDASIKAWAMYFSAPPPLSNRYVIALSVHPESQSQGVGSALMAHLTSKCDEEGVPCWVQSSDGSHCFYQRHGFDEIGKLELVLDDFSRTECGRRVCRNDEETPWGGYSWRYMERVPQRCRHPD